MKINTNAETITQEVLDDGTTMVAFRQHTNQPMLAVKRPGEVPIAVEEWHAGSVIYKPMSLFNTGFQIPSATEIGEACTPEMIENEIIDLIHKSIDLPSQSERVVARYIMMTWLYHVFEFIPMMRIYGLSGSGKTTLLRLLSKLCYSPVLYSAAVTEAVLYRAQEIVQGTRLIDEFNRDASGMTSLISQILNTACEQGSSVPRCESEKKGYVPRGHGNFGPVIVATRSLFEDNAVESRFVRIDTYVTNRNDLLSVRSLSDDIQQIINKLLRYSLDYGDVISKLGPVSGFEKFQLRFKDVHEPLFKVVLEPSTDTLHPYLEESYETFEQDVSLSAEQCVVRAIERSALDQNGRMQLREIEASIASADGIHLGSRNIGSILKALSVKVTHGRDGNFIDLSVVNISHLKKRIGISTEL